MRSQVSFTSKGGAVLLSLAAAATTLWAQESKPATSPHEPLLPRAPEMAAWTISYQYPDDKKHANRKDSKGSRDRIISVQIEKSGDTYHKVMHWDNGKQSEAWSVRGREATKSDTGSQYVPTSASAPVADDFTTSDFEDLSWLKAQYYFGLSKGASASFVFHAKHKERPLTRREKLVMEALAALRSKNTDGASQMLDSLVPGSDTIELSDRSPDAEDTILLDATTQLPIEYDQGAVKWTYQFIQPPTGQLEPPAEVNVLLEHWNNFIKSSESAGSPP